MTTASNRPERIAFSHPAFSSNPHLVRRESPSISPDFNPTQIAQIQTAVQQACTLAQSAAANAAEGNAIFVKYFPAGSAGTVAGVFNDIIGGDTAECAEELEQISITPDFADDAGNFVCGTGKRGKL
ncbi:hypothetical protein LTR85_009403 [Meristemomyces frigidus]|nr:hypothetical protein LTR85_009403 [Meristemomyces frigidus]